MSQKPNKTSKSIAEYEREISALKTEIDDLKMKLEHMNEILVNMQRARFGQSSEKQNTFLPTSSVYSMKRRRNRIQRLPNLTRKQS